MISVQSRDQIQQKLFTLFFLLNTCFTFFQKLSLFHTAVQTSALQLKLKHQEIPEHEPDLCDSKWLPLASNALAIATSYVAYPRKYKKKKSCTSFLHVVYRQFQTFLSSIGGKNRTGTKNQAPFVHNVSHFHVTVATCGYLHEKKGYGGLEGQRNVYLQGKQLYIFTFSVFCCFFEVQTISTKCTSI